MKVIFLDIDGVLNSEQFIRALYRKFKKGGLHREFCPICASNLLTIMTDVPDAKIVVSSSWRIGNTLEELQTYLFEGADIPKDRVIDVTPSFGSGPRGLEIQAWLNLHPEVMKFIILDDSSDMEHLMPRLVHTSWRRGLMIEEAELAVKMLEPTSACDDCGGGLTWAGGGRCDLCLRKRLMENRKNEQSS